LNTPDRNTFYGGDEKGYTDYPSLWHSPHWSDGDSWFSETTYQIDLQRFALKPKPR
jgi:hypothetical protein